MTFIPDEFERVNRVENGNDNISGEKIRTAEITFYIRKYSFSKIHYNSISWLNLFENSVHYYLATLLDGQPLEKERKNCDGNLTGLYFHVLYKSRVIWNCWGIQKRGYNRCVSPFLCAYI
jgi:hypothetical protein